MITLEGLRKDILRLQTLVISQGERIKELEEVLFPDDPSDSFCGGKGENHEK